MQIKILQARRMFGKMYSEGHIEKDPPSWMIAYAEDKVRANGGLICEIVEESEESSQDWAVDIDSLTKKELLSLAETQGIEIQSSMRKQEIKERILGYGG